MDQKSFIPPLPSLAEVKSAINRYVDASAFKHYNQLDSADYFLHSIHQELGILEQTFMLIISSPVSLSDQPFYRLRFPKTPIEVLNRQTVGPPPPEWAPFDRCSIAGHPVMYTSVNPATCFQEVLFQQADPVPMQIGYFSEWKVRAGCKLRIAPFIYHNLPVASDLHGVVESMRANVQKLLTAYYAESEIQSVQATLEYLSGLFMSDKYKSISSFIGHKHLYAEHQNKPDVFMYPSAQAKQLRANFAFHPNCLENLELIRVREIAVKDYVPCGKSFELRWLREFRGFDHQVTARNIEISESNEITQALYEDMMGYYNAKKLS